MNFKINSGILLVIFLAGFHSATHAFAQDKDDIPAVRILSPNTSINSYVDPFGEIDGKYIRKVKAYLASKDVNASYELMPWSRAFRAMNKSDNTLIIGLDRTVEREDKYHWLLELKRYENFLVTLHTEEMKYLTREEIIAGDYKAICDKDSSSCKSLEEFGFPKDRIIVVTGLTAGERAKTIIRGRADFLITELADLLREKDISLDMNRLYPLMKISSMSAYLAGPKILDPQLKNALLDKPQ